MPTLKLTYFDMPGRARVLRKALAMGGVAFTDEQVSRDQFEPIKPTLPYGMVPVLSIDGELVAESQAITRYVGRLTGMYPPPSERLAALMVDEVLDSFDDLNERLLIPTYQEDDAEKKKQMRLHLVAGPLRTALELIDRRVHQIGEYAFFKTHEHFVFFHEMIVWDYFTKLRSDGLDHIPSGFTDNFKTLMAVFNKVEATTTVAHQRQALEHHSPSNIPVKLTLMSFLGPDRADPIRLALLIAGITFQDERVSHEQFEERRQELPNGQLPVLTVDGHVCGQSLAILRYVGSLAGLYTTKDALLAAKIDEVVSHVGEQYFFFDPIFQDQRPDEKLSIRNALATEVVPEALEGLDKRLAQWRKNPDSPFAFGGELPTIADLAIFGFVQYLTSDTLDYVPNNVVDPFKNVLRVYEGVLKLQRV